MAPGRNEGLLRGVGGVGLVTENGERGAIHGIDPAADEGIEGMTVARTDLLDELLFHLPPS